MPRPRDERDIEDRDEPPARKPKPPRRETDSDEPRSDEPGGALKPLLITFGAVLLAFGGIMAFILTTAPKAEVASGDPPSGGPPDGAKPPKSGSDEPRPDDWTPPAITRRPSAAVGFRTVALLPDGALPPQSLGWVREAAYLDAEQLVIASLTDGKLVGYDARARAPLPQPAGLKAGETVSNVSATADQSAVYAKGKDQMLRFDPRGRQWSAAPLGGYGGCVALSADRFLVYESRVRDTQLRLYRWPVGSAAVTLCARWEVPGGVAALAYDAPTGMLWVARAKDWDATTGDLDCYASTGRGGARVSTTPLPFKVGITTRLIPTASGRVYVEDQAVEGNRVLPTKFPGTVVAAVGDLVLMGSGELADRNTAAVVGKAWDKKTLTAIAFSADQQSCWAYDFQAKTYGRYSVGLGVKPPGDPAVPPVVPPPSPGGVGATQLASLTGPANALNVFQYSDKHDLLFYSEVTGTTVLDVKTGVALPTPKLDGKARMRSINVAPDQSAAFASDGLTLHRLDLATRKWESRPFAGTRVLGLDATTALVQVKLTNPATWAVVRWGAGEVKELKRMEWDRLYELGYDPAAKALYALHSKTTSTTGAVLERYARAGDEFKSEGSKKFAGATSRVTLRSLTDDGKYFFQSLRATPTDLTSDTVVQFNEAVTGSVGGWAVGGSGQLYSMATGKLEGTLSLPADTVAAASDGRTVWIYARNIGKLVKLKIEAGKK